MYRPSKTIATVAIAATSVVLAIGLAQPASATESYPTLATANVRSAPNTSALIVTVLPKGSSVSIDCYAEGEDVSGTTIWDHTPSGWISDALMLTGSDSPVVALCAGRSEQSSGNYNRSAAAAWAITDAYIPPTFHNDCTWFVSQALWAGGLPQTSNWTSASWNFFDLAQKSRGLGSPSRAAASADYFKNALQEDGLAQLTEISPSDLTGGGAQLGDVILYDWDNGADGKIDHVAIVTEIGQDGTVGISQHTPARDYRQWNLNGDGSPLTNLRVYLLHITY